MYQIQYKPGGDWLSALCWGDDEYIRADFDVMSYFTSTNPASWLSDTVMGVKFIREGQEIVGKYTLAHDTFKKNLRGQVEVVLTCKSEADRVLGLEKYLGIRLSEEEAAAIRGLPAEIKNVEQKT